MGGEFFLGCSTSAVKVSEQPLPHCLLSANYIDKTGIRCVSSHGKSQLHGICWAGSCFLKQEAKLSHYCHGSVVRLVLFLLVKEHPLPAVN